MLSKLLEVGTSLPITLGQISFVWAVLWAIYTFVIDRRKKDAISDFEQFQKLDENFESLEDKSSLYKDMNIRAITLFKGYGYKEVRFLRTREKVTVQNIHELRSLKRSLWLSVIFNPETNSYDSSFPEKPILFIILTGAVFYIYAKLLPYIFTYMGLNSSGWGIIPLAFAIGIVEIPVLMNIYKIINYEYLRRTTDLFN